jgi:hypothetical protein
MSLVLAASIGARTSPEIAAAAVVMRMVAAGDVEARMDVSEIAPGDVESRTSTSATPNTAARKLLKNVSNVRARMLYTKVEFVARHIANAPPVEDRPDSTSRSEWGFFRRSWPSVCNVRSG